MQYAYYGATHHDVILGARGGWVLLWAPTGAQGTSYPGVRIIVRTMVKIILCNVKGLRSSSKRASVLCHLKRMKADVAELQETHLRREDFVMMRKQWVGHVFGSPAVERKAGILILISKSLLCSILQ